jgi:hypothetical protein
LKAQASMNHRDTEAQREKKQCQSIFPERILVPLWFFLLALVPATHASTPAPLKQTVTTDLDGDGAFETLDLDASREPALQVRHGAKLLWSGIPRRWKPWKLAFADVDGNGTREIVLGIHKGTKYFPRPHNCLFIYGWTGQSARKKWLGSSLSKPFTDFLLYDVDGDGRDELIALETLADKKRCVVCYSWNGFGWAADWQRGAWKSARLLGASQGRIRVAAEGRIETLGDKP